MLTAFVPSLFKFFPVIVMLFLLFNNAMVIGIDLDLSNDKAV